MRETMDSSPDLQVDVQLGLAATDEICQSSISTCVSRECTRPCHHYGP